MIDQFHYLLALLSGGAVGFTLGLVGGGGSILAVPLMVYVVGVRSPHVAIGTSALAVAANALVGLANHARGHNVNWRCGFTFATAGVLGALAGAALGKAIDGQKLLLAFALLMLVVAVLTWRSRGVEGSDSVTCNRDNLGKVLSYGFGTGGLSGFFGIGGGFLIVPALKASTAMGVHRAIGTSLVAVAAFGVATAASYAASGLIDWPLAGTFVLGGAAGSFAGTAASRRLAAQKGRLNTLFAALIFAVALYMAVRSVIALAG
jgi:uncharacterized membrane protein YfcA